MKAKIFGFIFLWIQLGCDSKIPVQSFSGVTMGVIQYKVKIADHQTMKIKDAIDSILVSFNQSLSTYDPNSLLSQFNQSDSLVFKSKLFYNILKESYKIYLATDGAFDPTVGPMINAMGFGVDKEPKIISQSKFNGLHVNVGFDKLYFNENYVVKNPNMYLDFSAIAKGLAVDIVADYLESRAVGNYMVEIGGEVRTKGLNPNKKPWKIGIDHPMVKKEERKLYGIASLENASMATSGNYRNFHTIGENTVAHIIDPKTGQSNFNSMRSATVFTQKCMTADAYATAFMVMGFDAASKQIESNPNLEALLIYQAEDSIKHYISNGILDQVKILD